MCRYPMYLPGSVRGGAVSDWREEGSFEGAEHGSPISAIVVDAPEGSGPRLHRHAYAETFVVQGGRGVSRRRETSVEAVAGEVVAVWPETPHGFRAVGAEGLRLVAIHSSPRFRTTWIDAPALPAALSWSPSTTQ